MSACMSKTKNEQLLDNDRCEIEQVQSVHFGMAPRKVVEKFSKMCEEYGGLTRCIRYLLSRKSQRNLKYQFQPLTISSCDWHIHISTDEYSDDLITALQELDKYVNSNRLKDRASGIEDLLFGTLDAELRHSEDALLKTEHTKNADITPGKLECDDCCLEKKNCIEQENKKVDFIECEIVDTNCEHSSQIIQNEEASDTELLDVIISADPIGKEECKVCHKSFKTRQTLNIHSKTFHKPSPFQCPICEDIFDTKMNLQLHCRRIHRRHITIDKLGNLNVVNRELLKCDQCDYVALRGGRMSTHRKEVHAIVDEIRCTICAKVFPSYRKRQHHVMQFHTMINIACDICGKICRNRSSFQRHHSSHSQSFQCKFCKKTFNDRRSHLQHEKRHLSEAMYPCPHCGREFNQKPNMERHVKVMHLKEGKLVCELCSYSTFYRDTLKDHIDRMHHGIQKKKFTCKLCNRGFARRLTYEEHLDKHEGRYRYSCEACGKKFRNKSRCKIHFSQCNSSAVNGAIESEQSPAADGSVVIDSESCNDANVGFMYTLTEAVTEN